jgi:hypothetical protein
VELRSKVQGQNQRVNHDWEKKSLHDAVDEVACFGRLMVFRRYATGYTHFLKYRMVWRRERT